MAKFTVNPQRYDPYRNFKFRIKIDNVYVAGMNKCSALKKSTEMVEWREGGDPSTTHKLPGKTKYDAITLTAGVTHDTTFEDWARAMEEMMKLASRYAGMVPGQDREEPRENSTGGVVTNTTTWHDTTAQRDWFGLRLLRVG